MYAHEADEWHRWRHTAPEAELDYDDPRRAALGVIGERSDELCPPR